MKPDRKKLYQAALTTPAGFLAFGFGAGLSPWAPGTVGTMVAIPIALLLQPHPILLQLGLILLLFVLGIYVCAQTSRRLGVHDHGGIVWDEIVGYLLCATAAPDTVTGLVLAFVLFRVFDIFKPWPIRSVERKLTGGFGIMADDIIAAAYTAAILLLLVRSGVI